MTDPPDILEALQGRLAGLHEAHEHSAERIVRDAIAAIERERARADHAEHERDEATDALADEMQRAERAEQERDEAREKARQYEFERDELVRRCHELSAEKVAAVKERDQARAEANEYALDLHDTKRDFGKIMAAMHDRACEAEALLHQALRVGLAECTRLRGECYCLRVELEKRRKCTRLRGE